MNIDKDLRKVMTSISAQNAQRTAQSVPQGNYFTFVKEQHDECKTLMDYKHRSIFQMAEACTDYIN